VHAVYLCAFGQTPTRQELVQLPWTEFKNDFFEVDRSKYPQPLLQRYQQAALPCPDDIEVQMAKAWGFDFHLPSILMLLRFDREFHDRYIQDTFRHDTFEPVSYQQAERLIRQHTHNHSNSG